jgi:hypothetical protein
MASLKAKARGIPSTRARGGYGLTAAAVPVAPEAADPVALAGRDEGACAVIAGELEAGAQGAALGFTKSELGADPTSMPVLF